jgi:quinol monooxygenase YgiN
MSRSRPMTSTRFVLVEVYRTDDAPAQHKDTAHYAKWRDIAGMPAEPLTVLLSS